MVGLRYILLFLEALLVMLMWNRCAVPKPLTGGDKDTQGPELVYADPPSGTTRFQGKKITLKFNEFLKQGDITHSIFISPIPKKKPEAYAENKKIIIRIGEGFNDSVTYVISFGDAIKDHNEGNSMAKPFQYAFTKGAVLDSAQIGGQVVDAYSGKGLKGMTVLLYHPDSVKNDNYTQKQATYVTQTDASGNFQFLYLKQGAYRMLAVEDKDQNFQYNLITERVAVLPENDSMYADTTNQRVILTAFTQDTMPPMLKSVQWLNSRNLILQFSEAITSAKIDESGLVSTLRERVDKTRNQFYYATENAYPDTFLLKIKSVTDTMGNVRDTILKIKFTSADTLDPLGKKFHIQPDSQTYDPARQARLFRMNSRLPETGWQNALSLLDSSKKKIPIKPFAEGFLLFVPEPPNLDTLQQYTIVISEDIRSVEGFKIDSTLRFVFQPTSQEGLSALRGQIITEYKNLILLLTDEKGKTVRQTTDLNFHFTNLKPGKYGITIIEDANMDGFWTSGRLIPRRFPEKVYFLPDVLTLKPNWEWEGLKINYPPLVKN